MIECREMRSLDEKPYIELWAGEPVEKVSPEEMHGRLAVRLARMLEDLAGERGIVTVEVRFWLNPVEPRTSLLPDVAYLSHERRNLLTEEERQQPPFAPDVAVEIRSPGDRVKNIEWKMHAYLKAGCNVGFDVIPEQRAIRAFTRTGISTFHHDDRYESQELPWLRFPVAAVFEGIV